MINAKKIKIYATSGEQQPIFSNQLSALFLKMFTQKQAETRMWANAPPDGRPAKHRWRPLFNAAKFG